jgi:AcrR family transcriptional regulator
MSQPRSGRSNPLSGAGGIGAGHPDGHTPSGARKHVAGIQRARMLAAMAEEVAEHGESNVTVARVVARSGVSRRTFYELFSDRDECFLAAFDDGVARASRYVLDSYDPSARWAERIRIALTGLLSFLDVERGAGRLLIVGSLGAGVKALERRERVLAQMIAFVDEGRTEAKFGSQLPPLTAEGIVGGVLSVLHSRLLQEDPGRLVALAGPLMAMVVLPYLGPAAARKELARAVPEAPARVRRADANPLGGLEMRVTYRTIRVLMAIGDVDGRGSYPSNRQVADGAGITDQGQMSKLLGRLQGLGLVENKGAGAPKGAPNAWRLTARGGEVHGAFSEQTSS